MTASIEFPPALSQVQSRFGLKPSRFAGQGAPIFEGVDPTSNAPVIVRVLRENAFTSAAERQRARRELQKLSAVRHAGLASVIEAGESAELTWYARELVEGETLGARLLKGPMDAGTAAWVAMRIAAALAELHRHGVQHRDLRPERVVLTRDGVKLLDAAVGRVVQLPDGRSLPGVPGYVSPEAITGRLVSFRSDLYALGATTYEALAGRPTYPVADLGRRVQMQTEGDPDALSADIPEALTRLVVTLLAREQRDRPFSAQQVERQLEPFAIAPVTSTTPAASTPAEDDFDMPDSLSSTIATEAPAQLPVGASDFDDRADEAPTSLHGFELPGASTIMGMTAPVLTSPSTLRAPPPPPSQTPPPPSASQSAAPVGTGTLNTRLPKMPTLPPIPSSASRPAGGSVAAPPPAARKATMLGMPMSDTPGAALPPPPASARRPAGKALDYDDLGDTTVNDDSRMFGLPGMQPSPQGSAVPPLSGEATHDGLAGRSSMPGTLINNGAPMMGGAALSTMQGVGNNPGYGPGAVVPPPPGMNMMAPPPNGPAGTMAMQMPPSAAASAPPMYPHQAPQQGYGSYPQAMQSSPMGYAPQSHPTPPRQSSVLPWVAGLLSVVAVASVGGLVVAKLGSGDSPAPATVTVLPQVMPTPEAQPTPVQPMPPMVAPEPLPTPTPTPTPTPQPAVVAAPPPQPARPEPAPRPQPAATANARTQPAPQPARTQPAPQPARTQPTQQPVVAARPQPATQPATQPVQQPAATGGTVSANDPRIQEALRARNYPQARTLLLGALRGQPNNPALHAQMGNVYERLGNRNDALNEYRAATRLDRRNTGYLHRLADLQLATGDRAGAITSLRQVLAIQPNDSGAQARLRALGG